MAEQKGRDMILKRGSGTSPNVFTTIGGVRTTSFKIAGEPVDITTRDDAENATSQVTRVLMANTGVVSVEISGSGIFNDDTAIIALETDVYKGNIVEFQLAFGNGDIWQGLFQVTNLEYTGEYNNAQMYNITLMSSGKTTVMR